MPELVPDLAMNRHSGELNDPQQRHLRVTCQYIDKLLSDVEQVLHAATSPSPFPRYVVDITPAQTRAIEDHIRRLRSQLLRTLAWQHMRPNSPEIPATRAVMTDLAFVDIAIEELKPSYMRGYGAVPEDAVSELNGVVYELRSLVEAWSATSARNWVPTWRRASGNWRKPGTMWTCCGSWSRSSGLRGLRKTRSMRRNWKTTWLA